MRTRQLPAVRREGGKRMKFGRLRTAALVSVCAGVAMLGTASAERFRLSHNTSNTTTWHKGAEKLDEILKEATGGDSKVRGFPHEPTAGGHQMKQASIGDRGAQPHTDTVSRTQ